MVLLLQMRMGMLSIRSLTAIGTMLKKLLTKKMLREH